MKAAPEICRCLRSGTATIAGLMREYHTAYTTIMCAVLSLITKSEYERIRRRNFLHHRTRARLKPGHKTWNKGKKDITNPSCRHKMRPNDDIRRIVRFVSRKRSNHFDGDGQPMPQDVRESLGALRQTISSRECIDCGYDFGGEPPFSCPKCGGLRFAIISQKKNVI